MTPEISLQIYEGKTLVFVKLNDLIVLSYTCVKVAADTIEGQGYPQIRRQEQPKEPKW